MSVGCTSICDRQLFSVSKEVPRDPHGGKCDTTDIDVEYTEGPSLNYTRKFGLL